MHACGGSLAIVTHNLEGSYKFPEFHKNPLTISILSFLKPKTTFWIKEWPKLYIWCQVTLLFLKNGVSFSGRRRQWKILSLWISAITSYRRVEYHIEKNRLHSLPFQRQFFKDYNETDLKKKSRDGFYFFKEHWLILSLRYLFSKRKYWGRTRKHSGYGTRVVYVFRMCISMCSLMRKQDWEELYLTQIL